MKDFFKEYISQHRESMFDNLLEGVLDIVETKIAEVKHRKRLKEKKFGECVLSISAKDGSCIDINEIVQTGFVIIYRNDEKATWNDVKDLVTETERREIEKFLIRKKYFKC